MRVLITGASGQVGRELVEVFADHEVIAADRNLLDVTNRDQVFQVVTTTRPDAIVNAAAWTAVDACESDPERAFLVNALSTRFIGEAARLVAAHLCHISTDYVFDGTKSAPYVEWDEPNPQSIYGHSKLAGERELGPEATIVRTSWVCGRYGSNMVKTILRLAGEHDKLSFVNDQIGHPTFADDLATAIRRLVIDRRAGLFHVTNQGQCSWYEFAQAVLTASGADPLRVSPIATADLMPARPAPRPANSVLDNAAMRLSGLALLPHYNETLERLVKELTK
ncbi:MAG: dTDP-4-dehydrorhamnose reductase [Acidimicrobiales bacterium]